MTVSVTKPAVNLREELASLRNQGGYQEQQFYFDSLVTNGTFDSDIAWTKGTGWTISGGAASSDGTQSIVSDLEQDISFTTGRVYCITLSVTRTSGVLYPKIGDTTGDGISSTGTFTQYIAAGAGPNLELRADANFVGIVDNVSIFEVDANNDVVHTMPKGWVPKDVYEDGLLQREGAAHDYEVVYDGFDYYVKPTVAPSATTQTCVIGVKA